MINSFQCLCGLFQILGVIFLRTAVRLQSISVRFKGTQFISFIDNNAMSYNGLPTHSVLDPKTFTMVNNTLPYSCLHSRYYDPHF